MPSRLALDDGDALRIDGCDFLAVNQGFRGDGTTDGYVFPKDQRQHGLVAGNLLDGFLPELGKGSVSWSKDGERRRGLERKVQVRLFQQRVEIGQLRRLCNHVNKLRLLGWRRGWPAVTVDAEDGSRILMLQKNRRHARHPNQRIDTRDNGGAVQHTNNM